MQLSEAYQVSLDLCLWRSERVCHRNGAVDRQNVARTGPVPETNRQLQDEAIVKRERWSSLKELQDCEYP